ncbi:hypothetical protein SAMN05216228_102770 [Rhizobium tibeticum]|uniref:Uncharacterized protein n=1 Tax=Rhizobium tibeticum TaxID=501024 RepID=A0A1H8T6Q1_9HYPH|nr:hypothetical protein RTCCBAU85039_5038 [Rhizobium tibeticum]SEO86386.1 hypothetical protein SAMN05216228_102770 [Rhizobium tibeticum]
MLLLKLVAETEEGGLELLLRYLRQRSRDRVPIKVLLWRDTFVCGTVINLSFLGLAILIVQLGYPDWLAVVVFFVPIPFNIFLWSAVWRAAAQVAGMAAWIARTLGSCTEAVDDCPR